MRLKDSPTEAAFRAGLRAWLVEAVVAVPLEPDPADWASRRRYDTAWQRRLFEAGYAGTNWPAEFGGRGASAAQQLIALEELQRAGAPDLGVNFVGMLHAGPTLFTEGTPAQRAAHLPAILCGEEVWCQGFSEPGAGSDLASLQTRAVRDGDDYVVNGQKIWTSWGHVADYCELLVRTDDAAPKHKGITWLILPMNTPGVEVRPLVTATGSTEFCELFLDDVRIPAANRVGAENDGWRVSMVTFGFERGGAIVTEMMRSRTMLADLVRVARLVRRGTGSAFDDPGVRRQLGHLVAEFDALWAQARRNVAAATPTGVEVYSGSVFKIRYAEALHGLSELTLELLGRSGLAFDGLGDRPTGRLVEHAVWALSVSISAGTSQIQRNIVAERILGLPREPVWTSR